MCELYFKNWTNRGSWLISLKVFLEYQKVHFYATLFQRAEYNLCQTKLGPIWIIHNIRQLGIFSIFWDFLFFFYLFFIYLFIYLFIFCQFLPNVTQHQTINLKGVKKNDKTKIIWSKKDEDEFQASKKLIANAVMLAHPNLDAKIILYMNVFDMAIGKALSQMVGNEMQFAFFSCKVLTLRKHYLTHFLKKLLLEQNR